MKKPILLLFITAAFLAFFASSTHAGDGIPDNCEYTSGAHYRPGIFPRYEAHTGRLVLVDWTSGEEVQVVGGGLADTRMLGWSPDCRYLATAVGTLASMDTVVWDVVENRRVGEVPDAQHKPHPVTWGPGSYLVVETRHGALLWHVPTNMQTPLTTSFNTTTGRNFSRLRWDAASNQLIVNLAVGGRAVYDLTTGAEVPEAVHTTDSINPPRSDNTVLIGGRNYDCRALSPYIFRVEYDLASQQILIVIDAPRREREVLQVLETNVIAPWFRFRGWSPNCRYVVGALGIDGQDASDTAIWDVVENRRVGTFPDARGILHPIEWSPQGNEILIQTRDGAYIWHLSTDQRVRLDVEVETALTGRSNIRSFVQIGWDVTRGQVIGIPVDAPTTVTAFDIYNGQRLTAYPFIEGLSPDTLQLSPQGSWLIASNQQDYRRDPHYLLIRQGDGYGLQLPILWRLQPVFSPDERLLVVTGGNRLYVWNLESLNNDGTPNITYDVPVSSFIPQFVDRTTLTDQYRPKIRLDLQSGTWTGVDETPQPVSAMPVEGENGMSSYRTRNYVWYSRQWECGNLAVLYDADEGNLLVRDTHTQAMILLATGLNHTDNFFWSPDCQYLAAEVSLVNDLPYDDAPLDDLASYRKGVKLTFWNASTGAQVSELSHPYRGTSAWVLWSPDNHRAFVMTMSGHYVVDLPNATSTLLTYRDTSDRTITSYPDVYWDVQRGQVLVGGWDVVFAFDLRTGQERHRFTAMSARSTLRSDCPYYYFNGGPGCSITVSPDNTTLFISGTSSLAAWNLDTLESSQVYTSAPNSDRARAISPDGRYLVIAYQMIRVWDLHNLAEDFQERDPIHRHHGPAARVRSVRFIDNIIIETESAEGVQRWNVETGQQVE